MGKRSKSPRCELSLVVPEAALVVELKFPKPEYLVKFPFMRLAQSLKNVGEWLAVLLEINVDVSC
jgi:hypothetical protein